MQCQLDVAAGLAYLGQGNYEKAAQSFLKVGPLKCLSEWSGKVRPVRRFQREHADSIVADCAERRRGVRDTMRSGDAVAWGDPRPSARERDVRRVRRAGAIRPRAAREL